MAVEDALGIAGGARGVAQARRFILVEHRPFEARGCGLDQLVEAQQAVPRGHVRAVGEDNEVANRGQLGAEALDQRRESGIEQQHCVAGVIGDELDLLGE